LVEGADEFLEGVRLELRAIVRTAVKEMAEILDMLPVLDSRCRSKAS
jgi:hypothetical protein